MTLRAALDSGEFVVSAELAAPLDPDPDIVRDSARVLASVVDVANVTDNQAATVKLSPLACAVWMLEEGLAPILQLTTRDRNVLALQSDLLGAWALGVRAVLALSGDPLTVGPYGQITRAVSDFDSLGLIALLGSLNRGILAAGEELVTPTDFTIVAAANPLVDSVEKLEQKVAAGTQCFQTNIVYDLDRFAQWFEPIVAAGVPLHAPVLVGVTPPRSTAMLAHMHDHIPGVEVDRSTFDRMAGLRGEEARAAGIEIAVEVIEGLRSMTGVSGIHLMAPGWESEAVPAVLAKAGIGPSSR